MNNVNIGINIDGTTIYKWATDLRCGLQVRIHELEEETERLHFSEASASKKAQLSGQEL